MKEVIKTFKMKDVLLVIRIATVCRNVQFLVFLRKKVREDLFISVLADKTAEAWIYLHYFTAIQIR